MTSSTYVLATDKDNFLHAKFRVQTNASIVRDLASAIARVSPEAHILVISNPVNSTVPIVASTLQKAGVYDPRRLFGVTTLDVVRAARFVGEVASTDPKDSVITVVGGHSGATIVPLLSQSAYGKAVTGDAYAKIVHRIQFGGDEVVQAKDGAGSATLSMAYAGAKFAHALLRGLSGEKGVVTPTLVQSSLFADQGIDFFSSNVELGVRSRLSSSAGHDSVLNPCLLDCVLVCVCRSTAWRRSTPSARSRPRRRSCSRRAFPTSRRTSRRAGRSSLRVRRSRRHRPGW